MFPDLFLSKPRSTGFSIMLDHFGYLLYFPKPPTQAFEQPGIAIECRLCRKCAQNFRRRDRRGKPTPTMPYCARARGMWGGPEPQQIAALTFLERRVVQLARVYVCVKRVLGR